MTIGDGQLLRRFVCGGDLHKKARLGWLALEPQSEDDLPLTTSFCLLSAREELIEAGAIYSAKRARQLAGWAEITLADVRDLGLDVVESDGDYDGHCDLIGWPSELPAIQDRCTKLSYRVEVLLIAPDARPPKSLEED